MTYTVVWRAEAERQLALIWSLAQDRKAVTEAADEIDALLRFNPENRGEQRDLGRRILIRAPLAVVFHVQPEDRLVSVLAAWSI